MKQLWRVWLQHDETDRASEFLVRADSSDEALKEATKSYGRRWTAFDVKPEPEGTDEGTEI